MWRCSTPCCMCCCGKDCAISTTFVTTPKGSTPPRRRSPITRRAQSRASAVFPRTTSSRRRAGSAARVRPCRFTVRGSTSRSTAPRKTPRLSICISPRGTSAGRVPARSRSPASRTRWVAAKWGAWPRCCRRIAIWQALRIAKRSPVSGASMAFRRRPGRPRSRCSTPCAKAASRRYGSPVPTRCNPCRIRRVWSRRWSAPNVSSSRRRSIPPRPCVMPTLCFPPAPGERRMARSPIPSVAFRAPARPFHRLAKRVTTGRSWWTLRIALEAAWAATPHGCFPMPSQRRSLTNTALPQAAVILTSPD